MDEEADQYKAHVAETEEEVTSPRTEENDVDASEEEDELFGVPWKVWLGLITLLFFAAGVRVGVLLSKVDDNEMSILTSAPSSIQTEKPFFNPTTSSKRTYPLDIESLAEVLLPGVDIFNLNRTAPQYLALDWLVYDDFRILTIEDDATELIERFSLVALYYATRGQHWMYRPQWLNRSSHHCDWDYFRCDENGRVTALPLSESNLHGTLPPEIGNFRNARTICLADSSIGGSIPTELGFLTSLTRLNLKFNNLEGTLPTEIGNLGHLGFLDVHDNQLVGTIPSEIGNLQQLTHLGLDHNIFSGTIPSEIGKLRRLEMLGLSENISSDTIPSEIGNLQQLTNLGLDGNTFSGTIPSEIGNLQQLTRLYLSHNTFSGSIPSELGNMRSLQMLDLTANKFAGTIPTEIGNLQYLTRLFLSRNTFVGAIPSEIGNALSLKILELGVNSFSGTIPSEIGKLQQLTHLDLSGNTFLTGSVPLEVGQLALVMYAYFQNTSLSGGLDDLAFCKNRYFSFFDFFADCGGPIPEIACECCTTCCDMGGTNCVSVSYYTSLQWDITSSRL